MVLILCTRQKGAGLVLAPVSAMKVYDMVNETKCVLTQVCPSIMMKMVTEGVSQPLSEKVISEFLLTHNKKFTSECFATHKCEFNRGKSCTCP